MLMATKVFGVHIGIHILIGAIDAATALIKIPNAEVKNVRKKPLKRNMNLNFK